MSNKNNFNKMVDKDGFILIQHKNRKQRKRNNDKKEIKYDSYQPIEYPNKKRILCNNMFLIGNCSYGSKCVYAHSIEEQRIDPIRKDVYAFIEKISCCTQSELTKLFYTLKEQYSNELFITLSQLSHLCYGCVNKKCLGGYNCKNGALDEKYLVCYEDLFLNGCTNDKCTMHHLSKYIISQQQNNANKQNNDELQECNEHYNYNQQDDYDQYDDNEKNEVGSLCLSEVSNSDTDSCDDIILTLNI